MVGRPDNQGMPGLYGTDRSSAMPDATASRVRVDVPASSTRLGPDMLTQHRTQEDCAPILMALEPPAHSGGY